FLKGREQMRINKTVSIIISFLIIWTILPLQANAADKKGAYETKDEVIYGKLYGNGLINEMYVVNSFYGTTEGKITDYGTYGDVRNLTDLSTIEKTDELVTFQSTGEDFY